MHLHGRLARLGAVVLEEEEAVLREGLLDLQSARVQAQRGRGRREHLVRGLAAREGRLPPKHEQAGEWHLAKRAGVACLRHGVEFDVPQRRGRADEAQHPSVAPEELALGVGKPSVCVAADHEHGLEPILVDVADLRQPRAEREAQEPHEASPEHPIVEVRVGEDDGDRCRGVQDEADEGLVQLGRQRHAEGLRGAPRAGHHRDEDRD
mmetsp:Transcript_41840/g.130213  ORF Transcript_41840/g.130213 Transcript_41840/m.130213 type:complete len:208 (+) Transcript_41840:351-974(+)